MMRKHSENKQGMSGKLKRRLGIFVCIAVTLCLIYAAFQIAVDPFGVFGDKFFDWYDYDMTQNTRAAKIAYINGHHEEYDSYVIGTSKALSLSCDKLNGYSDARFYNLAFPDGNDDGVYEAASYLIENFTVKNILLVAEPQNAQDIYDDSNNLNVRAHCDADGSSKLSFYLSYLFCNPSYAIDKIKAWQSRGYLVSPEAEYNAKTGEYNEQRRDIEPISVTDEYMARDGEKFPDSPEQETVMHISETIDKIRRLKNLCEQKGTRLTVMLAPQYQSEFLSYPAEQRQDFWRSLAEVTDFWDFSGLNSVNCDPRYFYDFKHFRRSVGDMALARVFGDDDCLLPEDFGVHVTKDTVGQRVSEYENAPEGVNNSKRVPILMYHSLTEDPEKVNSTTVTADTLRSHLKAMRDAGYESVSYSDLEQYVKRGVPLPEKPVVITFDDGYANNLTIGCPVLKEYGFTAQIAVVGCTEGKNTYKDTGKAITPHFALEDAKPWIDEGVITLNSHSYDMHQVEKLDGAGCHAGVIPLEGETEEDFIGAVREDYRRSTERLLQAGSVSTAVFTYPYGRYCELSEAVLKEMGVNVTVSTDHGVAEIVRGLPQSLRVLDRIAIADDVTPESLIDKMK